MADLVDSSEERGAKKVKFGSLDDVSDDDKFSDDDEANYEIEELVR